MRSLIAYLIGVIGTAIVSGLVLNALYDAYAWPLQLSMAEHGEGYALWRQLLGVLLVALIARVWLQPLWQRWVSNSRPASTPEQQAQN